MSKLYVQHDYQVTGKDYVETDGGGGGGTNIDYSEGVVDTGDKWTDGKKIYAVAVAGTTPATAGSGASVGDDLTDLGIDSIVSIEGTITISSDESCDLNYCAIPANNNFYCYTSYVRSLSHLYMVTGAHSVSSPFAAIIRFTKIAEE